MSEILHVTEKDFEQKVLQAPGRVLVDFWADCCGPCRMMAPVLEQLAGEGIEGLTIAKVNVDEEPALAQRYEILSIPALKLFEGGRVIAEQVGAMPAAVLRRNLGI